MNFLQPELLWATPLIALPIIIHLINQRRFRTIRWAAMSFLLAANRMSHGYARLRQWLILAARTLAVAGLIFAISRPLSSGWVGLAVGGRVDTTIILLDSSPSMMQQGAGGRSKLETAREQLVQSLTLVGSQRWIVIDSATNKAEELTSLQDLRTSPVVLGTGASSDIPAMLKSAYEYIKSNRPTRTEVWLASDLHQNDWDSDSGRWKSIRDAWLAFPQTVRIHLLAYPTESNGNRAIRVTDVRRMETAVAENSLSQGAHLVVSFTITQSADMGRSSIPVQVEIEGARSEFAVDLTGPVTEVKNHIVPLDGHLVRGRGRISLPADTNTSDNEFFFVFDRPVVRKTVVVAENVEQVRALELAARIPPDADTKCESEVIEPGQVDGIEWDRVALLIWQAPLPNEDVAKMIDQFLDRGGKAIFLPPDAPNETEFAGVKWLDWVAHETAMPVATWMSDQDLLAKTQSGTPLPVGEWKVTRFCQLEGEVSPLAQLDGGKPLFCRSLTGSRNAYFCATTAQPKASSLAEDGVVLYVIIQRALGVGAGSLGNARQLIAGSIPPESAVEWSRLAGNPDGLSTRFSFDAGVYRQGESLTAMNRSESEDRRETVADAKVAELFASLPFDRVDDRAGNRSGLIQEVWRLFLGLMMFALLVEAILCIPRIASQPVPVFAGMSAGKPEPIGGAA